MNFLVKIFKGIGYLLVSIILLFVIVKVFFPYYRVATNSMIPTIPQNSIIIVNRFAYTFSKPKRGDIIFIKPQENIFTKGKWAHRLIALPQDKVLVKDKQISVNGQQPQFSALKNSNKLEEIVVPDDSYFQKGDSETSLYGLIKKEAVIGKVVYIF